MEFSIGVFKCYNINVCIYESILLKLCGKCFKLIQNTQPTKCTVFFLRYLCYDTIATCFSPWGYHHGTGIKCQIFYKVLSTFYNETFLHHTSCCDVVHIPED